MSTEELPGFYRFYFLWSDPAVLIWAVYMDFFTPAVVVNAFVPPDIAPHEPLYDFALQQLGGALLLLAVLDIVLLRYSKDIKVWKIVEGATLLYDVVLLGSVYDALSKQKRLEVGKLRLEDWGGLAITVLAVFVRSAFLLDLGVSRSGKTVKGA